MIMEKKCILYCFKLRRLTLGIGNLMSSHSLSAGHVPLGLGRDTLFHTQVYQQRIARTFKKKVKSRKIKVGDLVLKQVRIMVFD